MRLITSFLFTPFFLLLFDYGSLPVLFFSAGLIAVLAYEFFYVLEAKGLEPYFKVGVAGSVLIAMVMYFTTQTKAYFFLTTIIIVLAVNEMTRKDNRLFILHMSSTIFGIIYTGWLGGHILLVQRLSRNTFDSSILLFLTLFLVWMSDTGAYLIGMTIGRHKIIPRISPSKTYEGFFGGMIFTIVTTMIFRYLWLPCINPIDIILLGILAASAGLAGDLVESAMKRDAAMKDTANTLPGHGGVLDRFDSILFALPMLYYYYIFILIPRL